MRASHIDPPLASYRRALGPERAARRRGALFLVSAALCAVTPPASAVGALSGDVKEQASGAPIAGAFVFATWTRPTAFSGSICDWIDAASTDAAGRYQLTASVGEVAASLLGNRAIAIHVYAPGEICMPDQHGAWPANHPPSTQICTRPASAAPAARLESIGWMLSASSCLGAPIEQKAKLLRLYQQLFADAQQLARSAPDTSILRLICLSMLDADPKSESAAGAQITHLPGTSAEDQSFFERVQPDCAALMTPPKPVIREILLKNPSPGGSVAAPRPAPPATPGTSPTTPR